MAKVTALQRKKKKAAAIEHRLTGHGAVEALRLGVPVAIEAKASCWLFATLAHFEGALDSPSAPSVKDRVLDWHMRYNIFCSNLLYIKDQLWCSRPAVDAQAVHECADLVSGLHLLPTQGRRGVLSTGKSGWSPAIGWGGTDAFFILSGCATRPQSNCRHTARVRVCHTAQACEPATFAPLSGAPLLV